MNEKEAWKMFALTGSVRDYLKFKSIQEANIQQQNLKTDTITNEISNHGTDNKTTEYW